MYRIQGTLREWVMRDEVRRFIAKKFKDFLLTYVKPKNENGDIEYVRLINEMVSGTLLYLYISSLPLVRCLNCFIIHLCIAYLQLTSAVWKLTIKSSYMFTQILLSGWLMLHNLFLKSWRKFLKKLSLICIQTTRIFTRRFMFVLPTYQLMIRFET